MFQKTDNITFPTDSASVILLLGFDDGRIMPHLAHLISCWKWCTTCYENYFLHKGSVRHCVCVCVLSHTQHDHTLLNLSLLHVVSWPELSLIYNATMRLGYKKVSCDFPKFFILLLQCCQE
jgi:hypothetical protein